MYGFSDNEESPILYWMTLVLKFCCGSLLPVFSVRFSLTFHLMFVHQYYFSSVWVAEWQPFGKELPTLLTICFLCILTICTGMARGREAPEADTRSVSAVPCPTIGNTGVQKRERKCTFSYYLCNYRTETPK